MGELGLGHHGGDRRSSSIVELETLGVTKKESHRFQLLAKVPEAELVKLIAGLSEVTASAVYGFAKKYGREETEVAAIRQTCAEGDLADVR